MGGVRGVLLDNGLLFEYCLFKCPNTPEGEINFHKRSFQMWFLLEYSGLVYDHHL